MAPLEDWRGVLVSGGGGGGGLGGFSGHGGRSGPGGFFVQFKML